MQNEGCFDLNRAIQSWRENFAQSPALRSENLNELESHLRDSIATLQTSGLDAEEAFLVAAKRVGRSSSLVNEFGKINGSAVWFDRGLWILLAVQVWTLISSVSAVGMTVASALAVALNEVLPGFGVRQIPEGFIPGLTALLLSPLPTAVAMGIGWWYFIRPKQKPGSFLQRLVFRPAALALTLFLSCIAFQLTSVWVLRTWFFPIVYHVNAGSDPLSNLLVRLPQFTILALLTFFVARKRLGARRNPAAIC